MHLLNFVCFSTSGLFKAVIKKFQKKIPDLETLNLKCMSNLIDFNRTTQVFITKYIYKCYQLTGVFFWTLNMKIKRIIFHQHLSLKLTFRKYCIYQRFNAQIITDDQYEQSCACCLFKIEVQMWINVYLLKYCSLHPDFWYKSPQNYHFKIGRKDHLWLQEQMMVKSFSLIYSTERKGHFLRLILSSAWHLN